MVKDRKPYYSTELLAKMEREHEALTQKLRELPEQIITKWWTVLKSPRAREYLTHGVGRRLRIVRACFKNVFSICPVDRTELFSSEELTELDTNLHSFVINVHGLLDNLAWVTVFEVSPTPFPGRNQVGLFNPEIQKHLSADAQAFLTSQTMKDWHKTYAKNFRDALAHRIPLYVPPYGVAPEDQQKYRDLGREYFEQMRAGEFAEARALQEAQDGLGNILPAFIHSYEDSDASTPVALHPQLICDAMTVVECIRLVSPVRLVDGNG